MWAAVEEEMKAFLLTRTMKSFLIVKATLLFLTSASVLAAQINLSNITTTNAVKTNDAILVNANLGGGVWATRTATKQAVFGDPFKVTSLLADNATNKAVIIGSSTEWTDGDLATFVNNGRMVARVTALGNFISVDHPTNQTDVNISSHGSTPNIDMAVTYPTNGAAIWRNINLTVSSSYGPILQMSDNDFDGQLVLLDPESAFGGDAPFVMDANPAPAGDDVMLIRNQGTNIFRALSDGSISTGSNTNKWKFNRKVTGATVALTTTNYLEIVLNGVTNKVALVQ